MSKKKKKLHLDASTEGENKSVPEIYHFVNSAKHVDRFYDLFIGKRKEIAIDDRFKYFEADSPFGPGKIIISDMGGWYDEASNEMGSMEDFLEKMFPILTTPEATKGVLSEYYDYVYPEDKNDRKMPPELYIKFICISQKFMMGNFLEKRGIKPTPFSK